MSGVSSVSDSTAVPVRFIALMAAMSALDAFSIDGMLPALEIIGEELEVTVANHRQYVVTALFGGFSIGVLIYGFVADHIGRRKPVIAGFLIHLAGSALCCLAESYPVLLLGRVLQGLGAAGPYVLSLAIVRDNYKGRQMARIMSLIMMIFIGVPMVAPFIGQGILLVAGWRSIFLVLGLFSLLVMVWFWCAQPETLKPEDKVVLSFDAVWSSAVQVVTNRQSASYLLAIGAASGAFIAYLSTAQQVFQNIYSLGTEFPVVFAALAGLLGIAAYFNSRWVEKLGMVRLVHLSLSGIVLISAAYVFCYLFLNVVPTLRFFLAYMVVVMFGFALLFGNLSSLALEPMGHIAGSAASLVNCISTLIAILFANLIGSQLQDNAMPVIVGFGALCALAWVLNYQYLKPGARPDDSLTDLR
ncbi:hypothetical protein AB833_26540 [Chromatiales bacterium (ex Bugula neritina AB1)]|nr:hypothetical protein AB833_26540 [Chromatiales bacterium (ex Bugula neritina AB1)]